MAFWNIEGSNELAVIDKIHGSYTYKELQQLINQLKGGIEKKSEKNLGVVFCSNDVYSLVGYLAALQLRDAVMLVDAQIHEGMFDQILKEYRPDWIYADKELKGCAGYQRSVVEGNYRLYKKLGDGGNIYSDLAVLLSTSGTTGSRKFVRLSYQNLQSNASAIGSYLDLSETERPITTLPMQYSYGLSVINSHLDASGTLLLTNESILSKDFWEFFRGNQATSFSGVPYTYQMLQRLRFEQMELPSLRYYTQAGGRLSDKLIQYFYKAAETKKQHFYVMYGQTEATARISYVPPQTLDSKIGSIGRTIPGGELYLESETGELIYKGDNVMLGYAQTRSDLIKGDELHGVLYTGDIAEQDEDGFFYIKGRMKRFIKLFGLRISLDEVEK